MLLASAGPQLFSQCQNSFYVELSERQIGGSRIGRNIKIMRYIARKLGHPISLPKICSLQHYRKLKETFHLTTFPRRVVWIEQFLARRFSPPPFRSDWLVPIETMADLRRAGFIFGNCLRHGAYDYEATTGEHVYFRVPGSLFFPTPAIVQVVRNPANPHEWGVAAIEGFGNARPDQEHEAYIRAEFSMLQQKSCCYENVGEADGCP